MFFEYYDLRFLPKLWVVIKISVFDQNFDLPKNAFF